MSKRHKAKGKSVIQMTQAGLIQKDLSTGETSRISHRPSEMQFHSSEPSAGQFLHNPEPAREPSKNNRLHIPSPPKTENETVPSSSQFRQKEFDFPETIDTPESYSPHTSGYSTERPECSTQQDFSPSASTAEDNGAALDNSQEYSPYAPEPVQYGRQDHHPSIQPPVFSHGRSEQKEHYRTHRAEESFRPAKDRENDFSPHASASAYRPENSDRQQFNEQRPFSAVREQGQEGANTSHSLRLPMAIYLFVLGSILLFLKENLLSKKKLPPIFTSNRLPTPIPVQFLRKIILLSSIIIGNISIPDSRSQTISPPLQRKQSHSIPIIQKNLPTQKSSLQHRIHLFRNNPSLAVTALREKDLLLLIIEHHKRQRIMALIYFTGKRQRRLIHPVSSLLSQKVLKSF